MVRIVTGRGRAVVALGVLVVAVGIALGVEPSDAAVLVRAQIIDIG